MAILWQFIANFSIYQDKSCINICLITFWELFSLYAHTLYYNANILLKAEERVPIF